MVSILEHQDHEDGDKDPDMGPGEVGAELPSAEGGMEENGSGVSGGAESNSTPEGGSDGERCGRLRGDGNAPRRRRVAGGFIRMYMRSRMDWYEMMETGNVIEKKN